MSAYQRLCCLKMNKQRLKSTISTCSDDVKKTLKNVYFTIKMTALWTDVERLHGYTFY